MMLKENIFAKYLVNVSLAFLIFSCSEKNDPKPAPDNGNLIEASIAGLWAADNLKLFVELSGRDLDPNLLQYDVDVYRVTYKTTYRDSEVSASGLVLLPKTTNAIPMISFQRGTMVVQSDAPSIQDVEDEDVISYSALASMGFITVVPDLIGFGESSDVFHPYYVEEPTADAVVDLIRAATTLAEQKRTDFEGRLFLAGYSQGGYATLAAHKSLQENPLEGTELIASFPGAGGYDINAMLDYFIGLDTYPTPYYLAYVGMSYRSYYDNDQILTGFFKEPYANKIPSLFDGINSSGTINAQLTQSIPSLIREEILSKDVTYPLNEFLADKFEENSLVDWTPVAPIFFYHGDADVTVPLQNSQATYERLLANGANEANLHLIIFPGESHGSTFEPYIEDVVKKLQDLR